MKNWMGCVAAMLLCASSARAAGDQAWSIGGGLGYSFVSVGFAGQASVLGGVNYLSTGTLTPTVSLERLVAPGTWLLLGAVGTYSFVSTPMVPNVTGSFVTSQEQGGVTIALGVRRFLTAPDAVVGVSLQGAAELGAQTVSQDVTTTYGNGGSSTSHASATAWSIGALGGIALDKPLLDQLTLRLAVQLLSISYSKTTTSPSDTVLGAQSRVDAALIFSPDLELRFAF